MQWIGKRMRDIKKKVKKNDKIKIIDNQIANPLSIGQSASSGMLSLYSAGLLVVKTVKLPGAKKMLLLFDSMSVLRVG